MIIEDVILRLKSYLETKYTNENLINETYLVVSTSGLPRWLLPIGFRHDRKIVLKILRQWQPYSRKAAFLWNILISFYRFGLLEYFPGIKKVDFTKAKGYVFAVYVGTPGKKQKLVVSLLNETSGEMCVVKIAVGSSANHAIKHEYDALHNISSLKNVPRAIVKDISYAWFSQTFVEGKLCSLVLTDNQLEWLVSLPQGNSFTLEVELKKLFDKVDIKKKGREYSALLFFHEVIQSHPLHSASKLQYVLVHGDFAPWNMKFDTNNQLCVFDWEAYEKEGLPLYDLCYYYLNLAHLFKSQSYCHMFFKSDLIDCYLVKMGIESSFKIPLLACVLLKIINNAFECARDEFAEYLLNLEVGDFIK